MLPWLKKVEAVHQVKSYNTESGKYQEVTRINKVPIKYLVLTKHGIKYQSPVRLSWKALAGLVFSSASSVQALFNQFSAQQAQYKLFSASPARAFQLNRAGCKKCGTRYYLILRYFILFKTPRTVDCPLEGSHVISNKHKHPIKNRRKSLLQRKTQLHGVHTVNALPQVAPTSRPRRPTDRHLGPTETIPHLQPHWARF